MAATRNHDLWLWLGVGISLIIVTRAANQHLEALAALAALAAPPTTSPPRPSPHPEDAISLPTLSTLASSADHDIRHAATKILAHRIASSQPLLQTLNNDLRPLGPLPERKAARAVVALLRAYGVQDFIAEEAKGEREREWRRADEGRGVVQGEWRRAEELWAEDERDMEERARGREEESDGERSMRWRRRHAVAVGGGGDDGEAWMIARPVDYRDAEGRSLA